MPYCIHCGVKLNDRYDSCPLCDIELEYSEKRQIVPPLYPKEVHKISIIKNQANTKEWITLHFIGFLTALITLLTTGIDFYLNNNLSWSLFVTISILFVYLSYTLIVHLKGNPILLYGAENTLLGLFLFGLDLLTKDNTWFVEYALPCFISLQLISITLKFFLKGIKQKIIKAVIIILVTNIFLIIINEVTSSTITWSLITTSIFIPVSLYLIYISIKIRNLSDVHQATTS